MRRLGVWGQLANAFTHANAQTDALQCTVSVPLN